MHSLFSRSFLAARILGLTGMLMGLAGCDRGVEPAAREPAPIGAVATSPAPPPSVEPGKDFRGMETCAECHAERARDFQETRHFLAARFPADPGAFTGGFERRPGEYQPRTPGLKFRLERDGTNYLQRAVTKTASGSRTNTAGIDLIYGGLTIDEVYLHWDEEGRILEMPVAYAVQGDTWAPPPGMLEGTSDFQHSAQLCLNCHFTHLEEKPGGGGRFDRSSMLAGITCERCHGPGGAHTDHHRANPEDPEGRRILNPSDLSGKLMDDLCIQCHSDTGHPSRPLFTYRPGLPLEDFFAGSIQEKSKEDEHTANQIRYLRQSPCYLNSTKLTCVTCHDPHHAEGPKNSASIQNSCLGCHAPADCPPRPSFPKPVQDRCLDCHMPKRPDYSTPLDLPGGFKVGWRHRRDHRIGLHPEAVAAVLHAFHASPGPEVDAGRAKELAERLLAHWKPIAADQEQAGRFALAMNAWGHLKDAGVATDAAAEGLARLTDKRRRVAYWSRDAAQALERNDLDEAEAILGRLIALAPEHSQAHHLLGETLRRAGRHAEAQAAYREALKHNPDRAETQANLGLSLQMEGRNEEAVKALEAGRALRPLSPEILSNLASAQARLNRLDEAQSLLRKALVLDANHLPALNNLGTVLHRQGKPDEAIPFLNRVLELEPDDAAAHRNLALIERERGNLGQVRHHLEQALKEDPNPAEIHHNLSILSAGEGRFDPAWQESLRATEAAPEWYLPWLFRAQVALADNRGLDVARQAAEQAVKRSGRQRPEALRLLAQIYRELNRPADARKCQEEAEQLER